MGPLVIDILGTELQAVDIDRLKSPHTGGVILFSRNIGDRQQVVELIASIRQHRCDLIVMVDQEGGKVQRLQQGFTKLPPLLEIGKVYDRNDKQGERLSYLAGWLMASECLQCGFDISLAPVLDLGHEISTIIGSRAFSISKETVITLGRLYIKGMNDAGMVATAKHFPGHGSVAADTHISSVVKDDRSESDIFSNDCMPFIELVNDVDAIMPAHIIYSQLCELPVGFSSKWLKQILRQRFGFNGAIISDDLSMAAADCGSYAQRVAAAINAGCDLVLVCNNPDGIDESLAMLEGKQYQTSQQRLTRLLANKPFDDWQDLLASELWKEAKCAIKAI